MSDKPKKPTDTAALANDLTGLVKHVDREELADDITHSVLKETLKQEDVGPRDIAMSLILGQVAAVERGGIEAMEAKGQAELVNSDSLPTEIQQYGDFDLKAEMSAAGFEVGKPFPDDPIFMPARLPEGWTRVRSDHAMWSYLLDEKGRQRASIFYKAAFYDRSSHMDFSRRFVVVRDYELQREHEGKKARCYVGARVGSHDSEPKMLFEAIEDVPEATEMHSRSTIDALRRVGAQCEKWLQEHYPEWQNPFKYWDLDL